MADTWAHCHSTGGGMRDGVVLPEIIAIWENVSKVRPHNCMSMCAARVSVGVHADVPCAMADAELCAAPEAPWTPH